VTPSRPGLVDELLEALGSKRRFEVAELEVGEVARQLVEAGLVCLVRARQQSAAVLPQVRACLLSERERPVCLVLHGLALNAGRQLKRL